MLATIALGAAQVWLYEYAYDYLKYPAYIAANIIIPSSYFFFQSPWGVAGGAIAGHLVATSIAIVGGSFLANYISEKLVGPHRLSFISQVLWLK